MIRSRAFTAVSLFSASLALTSCSLKKNLDEMHEATVEMPQKLDKMQKLTCTMYTSLRQGDTKGSRDRDLADIYRADTLAGKLAEAAEYMQGFEYQVWTTDCAEDLPREEVMEQSARELLAKMQAFATDLRDVNPARMTDQVIPARKSRMETLYALAATLHYVNGKQAKLLAGSPYPVIRPFDMLIQGLEYDAKKNKGLLETPEIPAYVTPIAKYRDDAIYLLRLRQNFLMAYAYAYADSDDIGNKPGTLAKLSRLFNTTVRNKSWQPKLENRTASQIELLMTTALNYSNETNAALVKLGLDPMVDETFAELWERADFSNFDLPRLRNSRDPADRVFAASIKNLMSARDRLVTAWKKSTKDRQPRN